VTPRSVASLEEELRQRARDVRVNEPLWKHVSMRIGGPADLLAIPRNLAELRATAAFLFERGIPFVTLGQGSNILVADAGVRGVVIKIGKGIDRVRFVAAKAVVEAGHGLPHLAQEAARRGLSGLEFAAGIPASVGGAVVMNAGAHGHSLSEIVDRVRVVTPQGEETLSAADLGFAYRTSLLQARPRWCWRSNSTCPRRRQRRCASGWRPGWRSATPRSRSGHRVRGVSSGTRRAIMPAG